MPREPKPAPPANADEFRQQMTKMVLTDARAIIEAAIEKAKTGHYCLTKLLFQLAGLYPLPVKEDGTPDSSLAQIFLHELGIDLPDSEPITLDAEIPPEPKALSPANDEH